MKTLGIVTYVVVGIVGLIWSLWITGILFGLGAAVLALFIFPATLLLLPWYMGLSRCGRPVPARPRH